MMLLRYVSCFVRRPMRGGPLSWGRNARGVQGACEHAPYGLAWRAGCVQARTTTSEMIVEALGQLFDVLRRPVLDVHAQMQAHARQHFLDLVERLAAEV